MICIICTYLYKPRWTFRTAIVITFNDLPGTGHKTGTPNVAIKGYNTSYSNGDRVKSRYDCQLPWPSYNHSTYT